MTGCPTLNPEQAAGMITEAIRKRPKKIATTLGNLGQLTYAIAPGAQDLVVNRAYQLFPEDGGPSDRRLEAEQRAFAQATRGVHWPPLTGAWSSTLLDQHGAHLHRDRTAR